MPYLFDPKKWEGMLMLDQTYYVIRHKPSGELMPVMNKGKGYTHWNPSTKPGQSIKHSHTPRLLKSLNQAKRVVGIWAHLPNSFREYIPYTGNNEVETKDDGRKVEDLEIIAVKLKVTK